MLIGHRDMLRRILYIVDALPAPVDSVERPVFFERGSAGLRRDVEDIGAKSAGALSYIGEWHSHLRGLSTHPSSLDRQLFAWLQHELEPDGVPAVMLIAGDTELGVHVERME